MSKKKGDVPDRERYQGEQFFDEPEGIDELGVILPAPDESHQLTLEQEAKIAWDVHYAVQLYRAKDVDSLLDLTVGSLVIYQSVISHLLKIMKENGISVKRFR